MRAAAQNALSRHLTLSQKVAVAVECEAPSARIDVGSSASVTVATGPNSVRVAVPLPVPDVAVIVSLSAVVDAVMVDDALPSRPVVVVVGLKVTSPSVVNVTS